MNKKRLNVFNKIKKYHVEYIDIESIVTNKFVKELRQKLNMTQTVFAEILGVTKKTIEKWEQGKNPVKGCSARLLYALNENPELIKCTNSITSLNRTLLLTIQKGGIKHLSRIVQCLADKYDIPMLEVNFESLRSRVDIKTGNKIAFRPGTFVKYIGKGTETRMKQSIKRIEKNIK